MSVELLNIDCMEYMKGLEDNSFDLCITSPPYNMNLRVNHRGDGYCSRQIVKEISTKYENYHDNLPMDEYENFLNNVASELVRVSELTFFNIQMVTGNKPALFRFLGNHADNIKEVIIWDKARAQPSISEGVLNSRFEFIIVLGANPIARAFPVPVFEKGTVDNVWQIPVENSHNKAHRAAFPEYLVNHILKNFSKPNQSLFDPFLGTGTTAISAHYNNLSFTGCELDEDYYKAACERFDQQTRQESLF